jgi:outer membrane receptor for monomeric catechols
MLNTARRIFNTRAFPEGAKGRHGHHTHGRGQRVISDAKLAAIYGVETKRFNEAVKRNLAKRLDEVEQKTEVLAMRHDTFSRNTRNQIMQVFDVLPISTVPDRRMMGVGAIWVLSARSTR